MHHQAPEPSLLNADDLRLEIEGVQARLWMCTAPGRVSEGAGTGAQLDADLIWLRAQGVEVLVTLLQDHEIGKLGDLSDRAGAAGLEWRPLPIPDGMVPIDTFDYGKEALHLAKRLRNGGSVAIHCWLGLGRTGTLAAAVLQALGLGPQEALGAVRKARIGTVANALQEAFLAQMPEVLEEVQAAKTRLRNEVAGPKPIEAMDVAELRHELYEARRLLAELTRMMRR